MTISVREASRRLGVTPRAIRQDIAAGRLVARRGLGDAWDVAPASVERFERERHRGRPWGARTAWAAVDLLAGGDGHLLPGSQRARLRGRLRDLAVDGGGARLVALCRGRADWVRYRRHGGEAADLAARLTVSGPAALGDVAVAADFGMTPGVDLLVGYTSPQARAAFERAYLLAPDEGGDVVLGFTPFAPEIASSVLVALDLALHGRTRERRAGLTRLEAALRDTATEAAR